MDNYTVYVYNSDIKSEDRDYIISNCRYIAIDTETTGLDPLLNELCTIQISTEDRGYVIQFMKDNQPKNLVAVLMNKNIRKIFHHANFDLRFLMKNMELVGISNVVCTKIAAKLLYGIKERNSLKDLLFRHIGVEISKDQQLSDWSKDDLSQEQIIYAINDTKYLSKLWERLEILLIDKDLITVAEKCFEFLPIQARLQNAGIENIFTY